MSSSKHCRSFMSSYEKKTGMTTSPSTESIAGSTGEISG